MTRDDLRRARVSRLAGALREFHIVDRFGLGELFGEESVPGIEVFLARLHRHDVGLPSGISVEKFAQLIRARVVGGSDSDREANDKLTAKLFELKAIPFGKRGASEYHEAATAIVTLLWGDRLVLERKEAPLNGARKKIDILYRNRSEGGFFRSLRADHGIACPYIPFECKNYNDDPGNPELDQLAGRLTQHIGKFGILLCRAIDDARAVEDRCRGFKADKKYLLVLADNDLDEMVRDRIEGTDDERVLRMKLRDLLLS
jgi:hypothetical protein